MHFSHDHIGQAAPDQYPRMRCRTSCEVFSDIGPYAVSRGTITSLTSLRLVRTLSNGWSEIRIETGPRQGQYGVVRSENLVLVPSNVLERPPPTQVDVGVPRITPTHQCEQPTCYLFAIPHPAGPTIADIEAATPITGGTPVEVTSRPTPPGWAEVLVSLPGGIARRYIRTSDLVPPAPVDVNVPGPSTTPGTPPAQTPGTPSVSSQPVSSPGERARAARTWGETAGELLILTSPLWGAVLLSTFLPPAR